MIQVTTISWPLHTKILLSIPKAKRWWYIEDGNFMTKDVDSNAFIPIPHRILWEYTLPNSTSKYSVIIYGVHTSTVKSCSEILTYHGQRNSQSEPNISCLVSTHIPFMTRADWVYSSEPVKDVYFATNVPPWLHFKKIILFHAIKPSYWKSRTVIILTKSLSSSWLIENNDMAITKPSRG